MDNQPSANQTAAPAPNAKPANQTPPEPQRIPNKPSFPIIPAIIIIVIIAIAGAGFLYLKGGIIKPTTTTILSTSTIGQSGVSVIANCKTLVSPGKYFISSNFKTGITSGSCINVSSSDVSIICDNSIVTGSGPFEGIPPFTYAISIIAQRNVTVSGCNVRNFSYGVYSIASEGLKIENNNLSINYMDDIYLNNTHNSTLRNNYLSKSSSTQGALFLTNGSSGVTVSNNTVQYNQYYGINVNSSNDTFVKNYVNGTQYSFRCSAPNGFVISSNASSNVCYNSTGCGFVECRGVNIPANLSRIILKSAINSCGTITQPGSYSLQSNISMGNFVNISNLLSMSIPCIKVASKNVLVNCKGYGILGPTIALSASNETNITIENCDIRSATSAGLSLSNISVSHFYNITLMNDNYGIKIYNTSVSTFSNIVANNGAYGIYMSGSFSNSFQSVNASHNKYGIYVANQSFSNTFNKNIATNNSQMDVYATQDSANATYDLMESTSCGTTDAVWAGCKRFISVTLSYTPLKSCYTIESAGVYKLVSNIDNAQGNCIAIYTSNVQVQCQNHTITAFGTILNPALRVRNATNVSVSHCNFVGFSISTINVTNSSHVTLNNMSVIGSNLGIVFSRDNYSALSNSTVNGTQNSSINLIHVSFSKFLDNRIILGQSHNIGIILNNSRNNTILNNSASRNYIGMELLGKSINNTIQNNTVSLSTLFDFMCPTNQAIGAESGGINYATTKMGCHWLAALNPSSPLAQCQVSLQPNLVLFSQDAKYGTGSTCFSSYNSTTINCAGHTIIATNGGIFAKFSKAGVSTIENCYLKGFVNTVQSNGTQLTVFNDTILEELPGTTAINISDSRFGASANQNNVTGQYRGIVMANIGSGVSGQESLKNNMVLDANVAYTLSNVTNFVIFNNTAAPSTGIGLLLTNSIINTFQQNNFISATTGMECLYGSQQPKNNTDLGQNSCSSMANCNWIGISSGRCP